MDTATAQNNTKGNPWDSLDPYAQLIRFLMPRASSVTVFDAEGKLRWSTDTTLGPDLVELVDDTLYSARTEIDSAGELKMLDGTQPVYVCWLRDDEARLLATVAILCRRGQSDSDSASRGFNFVHSLLRPALECLRRDLLARASIAMLHDTVCERDRDLELLLADAAQAGAADADELRGLVHSAVEHFKCVIGALLVPEKGLALLRAGKGVRPDSQLLARTHRQLLSMAQMRSETLVINRAAPSSTAGIIPHRILCCPVRHPSGRTMGVLALFRDQDGSADFGSREARLTEGLARRAASLIEIQYDGLSGLYTRSALEQRVRTLLGTRTGKINWCLLYIDTDQLHVINDHCGMHVGDQVISQLGELIRSRLPPGALAARISGDRFAVMLPSEMDDGVRFAESLRGGAELLGAVHANTRLSVSVSIGVAPLEPGAKDMAHGLATAEVACKAAKQRGRNRTAVYEAEDASLARRFADITAAARLHDAISADRLRLEAQLVVPLEGGSAQPPHFELLLRMVDEDGATLGPDSFLAAATRYQLMPTIDRWVIEHAIAALQPHAEVLASVPAVFAINISGQSLNDEGFGDFLVNTVYGTGLNPSVFCFELTESATMLNTARAEVLMRRLRRIGCGVALDDFGVGQSSLSYLRQLPVTLLKIDGSFVRDILKDTRAEFMVRAIAQLAHSMELATVAEYVETEEIRTRIATLGVDYAQGFAIGRPQPFAEALAQLPMLAAAQPARDPSQRILTLRGRGAGH